MIAVSRANNMRSPHVDSKNFDGALGFRFAESEAWAHCSIVIDRPKTIALLTLTPTAKL
jgi:hypothetical protein